MQVGLLWFDNDPHRGLDAKIAAAARRYREKFGRAPDTCYVNSLALDKGLTSGEAPPCADQAVLVVPAANVLPHHFWIGEEGEREARDVVRAGA